MGPEPTQLQKIPHAAQTHVKCKSSPRKEKEGLGTLPMFLPQWWPSPALSTGWGSASQSWRLAEEGRSGALPTLCGAPGVLAFHTHGPGPHTCCSSPGTAAPPDKLPLLPSSPRWVRAPPPLGCHLPRPPVAMAPQPLSHGHTPCPSPPMPSCQPQAHQGRPRDTALPSRLAQL